jgi:peptidoglycan hydrolase-like protein with peptidoglycan-binding domain
MTKVLSVSDIDSNFGPKTRDAVKSFQEGNGLTADGVVGPMTWQALPADPNTPRLARGSTGPAVSAVVGKVTWINIDEADQSEPVLKIGSTGLPVRRAQKRMSLVGYDVGGVDGRYGTATEAAVKKLQQQRGLAVDGVVGPQTWSIIDSLENEGPVS